MECGVVRYVHRICGSSSVQAFFVFYNFYFISVNIILLAVSVCSLVCGCSTEVYWCFIFKSVISFLKSVSVNWVSLSVVMEYGISNFVTMFLYRNFRFF